VSAINPGATDDLVVLTVADMAVSGSAGVTVTYATGVNGTVEDLAASGNALATDGTGVGIAGWDTGAPTITLATTQDNDGDGSVDRAVIVFDKAVDDSTLVAGGFTIGGVTVTGMVTGTVDDDTITLIKHDHRPVYAPVSIIILGRGC